MAPSAERPWRVIGADGFTYYVTATSHAHAVVLAWERCLRRGAAWQGYTDVHDDGAR